MPNFAIVHTETHDESKPAGTRARSLGDDDIREKDRAIRERLAVDHVAPADESGEDAVGIHKQVTMRALADDPTQYDDVGYLYLKTISGVIELFYKDSDGNELQITTGGKIVGSNILYANNVYITALNAAGDGSVNLIKASALNKPVLPDGAELESDAAPTTDVQITNKKYVDDQISAIPPQVGFGSWVAKSNNTSYLAETDGFVLAGGVALTSCTGYTDASNPPTTQRMMDWSTTGVSASICMPVKKGDYWKVVGGDQWVYWIPLGA